ncbi:PAS domain-containing sensor histidine kinase [Cupriavidus sp. CV2]|uniref:PAS domain-containing sensor histidine kinase n=1 Tax=Cupriavidus ulmosensis TaxID=3065913 RepID=UPI00296B53E6|nr:PAS domain-containing sensor histidine kinase [Cupriavidus sp. CV2]MDW3687168.1 PAS domain-containing sensor histidine kinase [Cupriavidus sp. CV2]
MWRILATVGDGVRESLSNTSQRSLTIIVLFGLVSSLLIVRLHLIQARTMRELVALAEREAVISNGLRRKKERLRTLFQAMPDGVAALRHDRVIDEANDALCEMLGVSLSQLRGATHREFVQLLYRGRQPSRHGCSAAELLAELDRPGAATEFAALVEFDVPDSPTYEVRLVHAANGNGTVLVLRDMTDRIRHERMKSHFVSTVAHELKSPMASVAGYAELLAENMVPQDKRPRIYQALRSRAAQINGILSDLLDLARIEARSTGQAEMQKVDMNSLARSVVAKAFSEERRIRIVAAREPVIARGDRQQLERAIRNLIDNALKYSEPQSAVEVAIAAADAGDKVSICVLDKGIGMTQEEAHMAFNCFYRAGRPGGPSGTGLGLTIVRQIVLQHCGEIVLDTESGRGTSVTLHLPAAA